MYKNVLVGTDGSSTADKAVEVAAGLARDWKAKLHIVTAYKSSATGIGAASGAALADSGALGGVQNEQAKQVGQRAIDTWGKGIETEVHAVSDSAPDAILNTAESVGADLIVVGSQGMQGARRVLGSVPNSVAHGANCAVLIVKTD